MHHILFDVDGTLVVSYQLDSDCYINAVKQVTGLNIHSDWSQYHQVTDSGILDEIIRLHAISNPHQVRDAVKASFFELLRKVIQENPIKEVAGAHAFLSSLEAMENVVVSIATGGWRDSAMIKLRSAGIEVPDIQLVSADDHIKRSDIVKTALRSIEVPNSQCTYFGDGPWDQQVSAQIGINFVCIGSKLQYTPSFDDFKAPELIKAAIGIDQY